MRFCCFVYFFNCRKGRRTARRKRGRGKIIKREELKIKICEVYENKKEG